MKLKPLFFAIILFAGLQAFAQQFKTPVAYLSYIGKEQENISKSMWKYTSAVAHSKSARRIDNTRKQLIKSIQDASKKITAVTNGYNGDLEFRNQVLDYLSISEKNINEEYDKIINMQEVAEQSYDFMEAYITFRDLINKKMDEENEKVNLAQKNFALKYNITITENNSALANKMKISNLVFDYHSKLYLIFFKVNFTDLTLTKAIEMKNLAEIQQNSNTLLLYADEGLEKLKSVPSFKKDTDFINSTKKALEFYKKQAQVYTPKVVDFFMFNEKIENAKKILEAKKEQDRTKEEINNFNAMVKQANKEIDNYNKANQLNFQEKNTTINNWNSTADNFISKYIPVD
ncbi:LIC11966 family surface protein [Flavobacterium pedocola]